MSAVTRVFVIDDSAVVRKVLSTALGEDPSIVVSGAANDPIAAEVRMRTDWPDVIVLDIEMPRMDGITYLRKLMAERPTPVVICSTLTERGAETTLNALAAGAVGFVTKPRIVLSTGLQAIAGDLIRQVKIAALTRPRARPGAASGNGAVAGGTQVGDAPMTLSPTTGVALARTTEHVIAIGTSTGGTQALETVLSAMPVDAPGMVIVQHMPANFTRFFAQRLDNVCQLTVREAVDGDRVLPGCALIAPGGQHMRLVRSGAQYRVAVVEGPPVNRHRPSVDVLFQSVAQTAGRNALGVIMTGMGSDGARGLLEMHRAGARTLAQDEASCVVFGMPREAVRMGGVDQQVSLDRIASELLRPLR